MVGKCWLNYKIAGRMNELTLSKPVFINFSIQTMIKIFKIFENKLPRVNLK